MLEQKDVELEGDGEDDTQDAEEAAVCEALEDSLIMANQHGSLDAEKSLIQAMKESRDAWKL